MNILISCAGKQKNLIDIFRNELKKRSGLVIVCDHDQFAPALTAADIPFISPPINNTEYPDWILNICKKNNVRMLLSLFDDDLMVLSKFTDKFEQIGCELVAPPSSSLEISIDKLKTFDFCRMNDIQSPETYSANQLMELSSTSEPVIGKPRYGRGSRGLTFFNSVLKAKQSITEKCFAEEYIFQQVLEGQEYGLDVINDLNRNFKTVFSRKKIKMRNGETDIAETVSNTPFLEIAIKLSANLKHKGLADFDVIVKDNQVFLIDMNLRFGGGYPFSHLAGANMPACLISWAAGDQEQHEWLDPLVQIRGARYSMIAQIDTLR